MSGFRQREGDFAITSSGGVYKQVDVFERDGFLYVRHGSGFVQVSYDGSTTKATVRVDELNLLDGSLVCNATGRLAFAEANVAGARTLPADRAAKLGLPAAAPRLEGG